MKVIGIRYPQSSSSEELNITLTVKWKQPHGFLSAIDFPLLRFYVLMCIFYASLALIWLVLCINYYKDILRIQYWIGAVIILGMIEKAFFLAEYSTMNNSGRSVEGVLELAELVSCAKRTMSRVLVIIVSVGYGVVKPRLGSTLSQGSSDSVLDRYGNDFDSNVPLRHKSIRLGAVIILGMIEKAFFLAEYSTMNNSGRSVEGVLELAELVSCAKRTMSRVLVIIVSVGYGVVKPRLGSTLSQVLFVSRFQIQRYLLSIILLTEKGDLTYC
ncbi:unnamed protein product [Heligmosomoides polygyrus]|uniref:Bestrophin homolog n=1 Tax=Heligmosomoides polygyrus TaxID=6339 RepID=A0A183G691_HELPZ|nr:unnamed protein product [Heligmosomoides polygyrus]